MSSVHTPEYRRLLERLKAARVAVGMTQVEVAERLGLTQSHVSKCESGERRIDAVELKAFAELYGVTVGDLLEDQGQKS